MEMVSAFLHASILVSDTTRSLEFYSNILGLQPSNNRPDLGYPGAWLAVGGQQIHLIELPNPDPTSGRPAHGGHDRHIALGVNNMEELQRRLEEHSIAFTKSRSGRGAIFFRDPDGNAIECVEAKA